MRRRGGREKERYSPGRGVSIYRWKAQEELKGGVMAKARVEQKRGMSSQQKQEHRNSNQSSFAHRNYKGNEEDEEDRKSVV